MLTYWIGVFSGLCAMAIPAMLLGFRSHRWKTDANSLASRTEFHKSRADCHLVTVGLLDARNAELIAEQDKLKANIVEVEEENTDLARRIGNLNSSLHVADEKVRGLESLGKNIALVNDELYAEIDRLAVELDGLKVEHVRMSECLGRAKADRVALIEEVKRIGTERSQARVDSLGAKQDREYWFHEYNVLLSVKESLDCQLTSIKTSLRNIIGTQ